MSARGLLGGLLACAVVAAALVTTGGATASAASDEITLVFRGPAGQVLAGEKVRVYLLPYQPAAEDYVLIASGRADGTGRFRFSMSSNQQVAREARRGNGSVNVHVRATDNAHRWLIAHYLVLDVGKNHRQTVRAWFEIPDDWTPTDRDLLTVSSVSRSEAGASGDKKPQNRWVRVMRQHLSKGMVGHFSYLKGRGTDTQVGIEWTNGEVGVGGWMTESKGRSDQMIQRVRRPFNRLWQVEYTYRPRFHCTNYGFYSGQCERGYWKWYPDAWTWGARSRIKVRRDPMKKGNAIPLRVGRTFVRDSRKNVTFGMGVKILGLHLGSNADYSAVTKLSWTGVRGCKKRWLYGKHMKPGKAKVVQARSRGCR